jgi:hypothetical protein
MEMEQYVRGVPDCPLHLGTATRSVPTTAGGRALWLNFGCPVLRFEAVKKPKLGNGFKNFSQLEALQAIIRTSVYILHHPKNPTNHWQIGFFTASF